MSQITSLPEASALVAAPLNLTLDRFGASASLLCAIHCALLPFVGGLLPLMGLAVLGSEHFEQGFVALALSIAAVSLVVGYRQHRRVDIFGWLLGAAALFAVGLFSEAHHHLVAHTLLVVSGGLMLAWAHLRNLQHTRKALATHCCKAC